MKINYLLEKYVGEKGIMKYAKMKKYQYEQEKLMTRSEFLQTINLGLSFIENRDVESDGREFGGLFEEIAVDGVEIISQKDYFLFLK